MKALAIANIARAIPIVVGSVMIDIVASVRADSLPKVLRNMAPARISMTVKAPPVRRVTAAHTVTRLRMARSDKDTNERFFPVLSLTPRSIRERAGALTVGALKVMWRGRSRASG